ncbi:Pyridoxal 5'-phosphate synthase subunit PdxS [Ureibacillus acetophenoni]
MCLLVLEYLNQKILEKFARAIVEATTHYKDYKLIAEISKELGTPMKGIDIATLDVNGTYAGTRLVV